LEELLEGGATDLEFIFRKEDGGILFSGSIPFQRGSIENTNWRVDLARQHIGA